MAVRFHIKIDVIGIARYLCGIAELLVYIIYIYCWWWDDVRQWVLSGSVVGQQSADVTSVWTVCRCCLAAAAADAVMMRMTREIYDKGGSVMSVDRACRSLAIRYWQSAVGRRPQRTTIYHVGHLSVSLTFSRWRSWTLSSQVQRL